MPRTIIEKILERASGKTGLAPGDRVWARLNLVAMRDFGGPNAVLEYRAAFGDAPVFNPAGVAFTFDLHCPPRDEKVARNQQICREFAAAKSIRVFDVDTGVGQHVLFEHGLVKPWDVVIGTDSHMNLLGVFGAFASGVGTTDIVAGMRFGKLWFKVPPSLRIVVEGTLAPLVSAKDVILEILRRVGTDGALYRSVEFAGPTVDAMSWAAHITLASMVTEMSGKAAFVAPTQLTLDFLAARLGRPPEPVAADPDARYEATHRFDISRLEPVAACPHSPDNVRPVRELAGTKIDEVFLGSCTDGRVEDLTAAAALLKGRTVAPGMRLIVTPATQEVARQAQAAGLYDIFLAAGAIVTNPSCALCTTGHPGILAPGERLASTSNRNFVGKLGKGGEVYLVSPQTAAATALRGVLTDPREVA